MDVPVPLQLRALLNMFSRFSCVVLVISSLIATFSNWNDEFQCRASVKQCRTKICNQQIMLLLVLKLACFTLGGGEKHNRKGSQ